MGVRSDSSQALCPAVDHSGGVAWPPGFRFHPTDEELILYYLKRKICRRGIKLDVIRETDVYKWDPEELPGQSLLKTGDRQWFFFSPRERRYPNAARSNRATRHGYWKATGKDRNITCNSRSVGVKKTLVFYQGRAPNGERADWVMHEYTLDEDELNRCQNVQDYYALYKVFKKSGPGPKNGEQYGAPFKEEEWDEDDHVEVTCLKNSMVDSTIKPSFDELEEFMNQLDNEPLLGEQTNVLHSSAKQCNAPARFDITQSATSQLQMYEASEVISAHDNFKHKVDLSEEGFLEMNDLFGPEPSISNPVENMTFDDFKHRVDTSEEGFLEMDDLVGPEPTISNSVENVPFEEIDGLGEVVDLFLDSDTFLHDMGPIDQAVNTLDSDLLNYQLEPYMVNELHYQAQPDDMVNQLNYLLEADDTVNQVNYPFLPDSDVSDQLWMDDQRGEVVTLSESNQGTSGALLESAHVQNPEPSGQQHVATTGRFSSALWSFVESIPTTPASAAEGALVNRAFERMSSFSRLRINANVDSNRAVTKRSARNRGFIFFSVLGAICAILWVFMGTVRLWGRCILA